MVQIQDIFLKNTHKLTDLHVIKSRNLDKKILIAHKSRISCKTVSLANSKQQISPDDNDNLVSQLKIQPMHLMPQPRVNHLPEYPQL